MIKVHFNACGARGGNDMMGRTKGGNNTKITVCCDEKFHPVALQLDQGNRSDSKIGEEISNKVKCSEFVADKGYDSNAIRDNLNKHGIISTIPYRRNRKDIKEIDKNSYKQRNVIERFFLKLKKFRRLATRYDKLSSTFFNLIIIAFICLAIGL
jgi:transposase